MNKTNLLKKQKSLVKNLDQEQKKDRDKKRNIFEKVNALCKGR